MEMTTLDALVKVVPLIQQMFTSEVGIGVTDQDKFLTYLPSKDLNFGVKPGDPIQDQAMKFSLSTGKRYEDLVPEQAFGVPFRATVLPIREEGKVVGCIGLAQSLRTELQIQNISSQLAETMHQIVTSSEEISASAESAASRTEFMAQEAVKVEQYIESTNDILRMVKYVADRTRLIGLNAAIEAARAGQFGKSFSVVADEVRKLADKSQESVLEVNNILKQLQSSVSLLINFINEMNEMSQSQAAASEEVSASTEEITAVIEELSQLAKKLS